MDSKELVACFALDGAPDTHNLQEALAVAALDFVDFGSVEVL